MPRSFSATISSRHYMEIARYRQTIDIYSLTNKHLFIGNTGLCPNIVHEAAALTAHEDCSVPVRSRRCRLCTSSGLPG